MLSMLWGMFSSWGLSGEPQSPGDHLMDTSGVSWLLNCEPVILLVGSVYTGLVQQNSERLVSSAVSFQYSSCA